MAEQTAVSMPRAMWRYRIASAVIILAVVILSGLVALQLAPEASARAVIGIRTPQSDNVLSPGIQGDASLARYTTQRSRFASSDEVISDVAQRLGYEDFNAVRARLTISPSASSNTISIVATGATPDEAVALALAMIDAYRSSTQQQVESLTEAAIDSVESSAEEVRASVAEGGDGAGASAAATLSDLQRQTADLQRSSALLGDGVEFVQAPDLDSVIEPGIPIRELALGLVLGVALAATLAWVRADRDRRVTDPDRASAALGAPFLGLVPTVSDEDAPLDLGRLPEHDYQPVWTTIAKRSEGAVTALVSVGAHMSTRATANLATAAASDELSVLVVDGEVEQRMVSSALHHDRRSGGLLNIADPESVWRLELELIPCSATTEFWLLPIGGAMPGFDLPRRRVSTAVGEWRRRFSFTMIAIDGLASGQLSAKLASSSDGMIILVAHGADERELEETRRLADLLEVEVIGFVYSRPDPPFWRRLGSKVGLGRPDDDDVPPPSWPPIRHAIASSRRLRPRPS